MTRYVDWAVDSKFGPLIVYGEAQAMHQLA